MVITNQSNFKQTFVRQVPGLLNLQRRTGNFSEPPKVFQLANVDQSPVISQHNISDLSKLTETIHKDIQAQDSFEISRRQNGSILIPSIKIIETRPKKIRVCFNDMDSRVVPIRKKLLVDGGYIPDLNKAGNIALSLQENDPIYLFFIQNRQAILLGQISLGQEANSLNFALRKSLALNLKGNNQ